MSCSNTIPIGSDVIIRLNDLTDNLTGLPVSDATATGLLVVDGTNDYSFAFQADDTNGNYYGVIPAAVTTTLTQNDEYSIVVSATKGAATHSVIIETRARVKEYT